MNPSVDVGRPPRPFRHLRMAQHRSPDPSSSRAPVHSALVQISVTRHHQPGRSAFNVDAREKARSWQVEERKKLAESLQLSNAAFTPSASFSLRVAVLCVRGSLQVLDSVAWLCVYTLESIFGGNAQSPAGRRGAGAISTDVEAAHDRNRGGVNTNPRARVDSACALRNRHGITLGRLD